MANSNVKWNCVYVVCILINIIDIQALQTFEKSVSIEKRSIKDKDVKSEHLLNKRSTDSTCPKMPGYIAKLNATRDVHIFGNDSNPSISLTWSGKDGVLLALTTMNGFITRPSRLYRSVNRGKSFQDISSRINNDYIRKSNGIQVSPVDSSNIILVGYNSPFSTAHTKLHITHDAGATFLKSTCPFVVDASSFKFHPVSVYRVLAISTDHTLWMTKDFGVRWTLVSPYVVVARWDPLNADVLYYTHNPKQIVSKASMENELFRYNVATGKSALLAQHVHSFAVQDKYILLSVQFSGKNGSRVLHVSKNEGHAWNAAQLPMINQKQFYSLLDMSEDMVFVHVDVPGDTGHGDIYTSDERGIVYSLSLSRHLYPNNEGITDFYKVLSLPGVYITSQLSKDNTVHSLITFDKGGTWQAITRPEGSTCPKTEKACDLQIHNYFSASKGVRLPSLPLSSKNTVGLIMAHGNLGDGLSFNSPDVYISNDGGYKWVQPSGLKGPHYFGIGDSGGILFAIPSVTNVIDTLMFSLDEGQCWLPYKFSDKKIRITGLSVEPGEKATDLSIWGWDSIGDGSWMALTVDFSTVLGTSCSNSDYVTWVAHETNSVSSLHNKCMLGARRTFVRRKKGTVCLNGNQLVTSKNEVPVSCPCRLADFMCDYGYKRNDKEYCIRDTSAVSSKKDICIDDNEELITTQGYRKIPGDKCQGGYEPKREVMNLHKSCAKVEEKKDDFGVDSNHFEVYTPTPPNNPHTAFIILLVIAVLVLGSLLGFVLYRKRKSSMKVLYTPLSSSDSPDHQRESLIGTKTVFKEDDQDNVLVNVTEAAPRNGGAIISYHDDSDDDLLVT